MAGNGKPVVVVGSINMDLVSTALRIPAVGETITGEDFQMHHGGKGANQAVAVGCLGYPVAMIGRLGSDAFGTEMRQGLIDKGVNVAGVMTSEGTSGVAVILVGGKGENSIVITPGANALLTPKDLDGQLAMIRGAGMVLAQLETPLETVLHLAEICEREGVPLMLDPAPARELPPELLKRVTWFTPNETEAAFYAGEDKKASTGPPALAAELMDRGVRGVVLKLGERGAYLASSSGAGDPGGTEISPFAVKAVDTTAAGDCFNGAFAAGLMMGMGPEESARLASAASAISVTRRGAQPSMPGIDEVRELLARPI